MFGLGGSNSSGSSSIGCTVLDMDSHICISAKNLLNTSAVSVGLVIAVLLADIELILFRICVVDYFF